MVIMLLITLYVGGAIFLAWYDANDPTIPSTPLDWVIYTMWPVLLPAVLVVILFERLRGGGEDRQL